MVAYLRRWGGIGLVLAVLGLAGCNVLSLPFFIFGPEPSIEPQMKKVSSEDRKKEVKVLILTYAGLGLPSDFLRVDRDLTERLRANLKAGFEYNKENVKIVGSRKVEEFKNANEAWQTMDLAEIGEQFGADYIVYLEIRKLSLYEKGSLNSLYRGRAEISVTLVDVSDNEELPLRKEFSCQYPSESRQGMDVSDVTVQQFKDAFLNHVAQRLSWYFVKHPTAAEQKSEVGGSGY